MEGSRNTLVPSLCTDHGAFVLLFVFPAENVDVAVEVSLQPWRAFQPDGVILFSDILTFLP